MYPMAKEVERIITGRVRDIGDFNVRRILPYVQRRHVGPYVFFDHMGPADLTPGRAMDVRPHPHIGLATLTYLLEGRIQHRDSLGSDQVIMPGAINLMTAGRGIVHSERTPAEVRAAGSRIHGLQVWIALRTEDEECAPDFQHYPAAAFAEVNEGGATVRVLVGDFYGASSPVKTRSRLFYGDATLEPGASLPMDFEYEESAAYVVSGAVTVGETRVASESMVVFTPGEKPVLRAEEGSRVMLLGGDRVDGPRFIEWNFVSSSQERIDRAKREWRERAFPLVPGDREEFIPLPE